MKKDQVTKRLMELINNLPDDQQLKLLQVLENKQRLAPKSGTAEKRAFQRKVCTIDTVYANKERVFWDVINNLSAGGAYIQTDTPLDVGEEVSLAFSPYAFDETVRVTGTITRSSQDGFSVKFDSSIRDFIHKYERSA